MATRFIRRKSNGEVIEAKLVRVDWISEEVIISIPEYNAVFTFIPGDGFAVIKEDGRQPIDSTKESILHLSETVYWYIAQWAQAIFFSRIKRKKEVVFLEEKSPVASFMDG